MFSHRKNVECGSGSGYEETYHSNRGSESEDKRSVFLLSLKAASIVSTSLDSRGALTNYLYRHQQKMSSSKKIYL